MIESTPMILDAGIVAAAPSEPALPADVDEWQPLPANAAQVAMISGTIWGLCFGIVSGILIAVPGRGHDGQPQPVSAGQQSRRRRRPTHVARQVGVGRWLDRQMPIQARQGVLGGCLGVLPGSSTRQDLSGPERPREGDDGVGACPVAV